MIGRELNTDENKKKILSKVLDFLVKEYELPEQIIFYLEKDYFDLDKKDLIEKFENVYDIFDEVEEKSSVIKYWLDKLYNVIYDLKHKDFYICFQINGTKECLSREDVAEICLASNDFDVFLDKPFQHEYSEQRSFITNDNTFDYSLLASFSSYGYELNLLIDDREYQETLDEWLVDYNPRFLNICFDTDFNNAIAPKLLEEALEELGFEYDDNEVIINDKIYKYCGDEKIPDEIRSVIFEKFKEVVKKKGIENLI